MTYKFCPYCKTELVERLYHEQLRLLCPADACDYVFWNNPVPVVAAIVEIDNDIVLARNKNWPEKMFGLITGFLEKDETPEEAVIREVTEELALDGMIESFIGNYTFYQMNQLIIAFHVSAKGEIQLGDELAEYKLIAVDKLKPWSIGTGHAVKDWLANRESDK